MKPKKDNRYYPYYSEQVNKLYRKFDKPMSMSEYFLALSDWTVSPPIEDGTNDNIKKDEEGNNLF